MRGISIHAKIRSSPRAFPSSRISRRGNALLRARVTMAFAKFSHVTHAVNVAYECIPKRENQQRRNVIGGTGGIAGGQFTSHPSPQLFDGYHNNPLVAHRFGDGCSSPIIFVFRLYATRNCSDNVNTNERSAFAPIHADTHG